MVSAIIIIVLSQVVLAGLLFGTVAIDRPRPQLLRRRTARPPIETMREHQRGIVSLGAAAERSVESLPH